MGVKTMSGADRVNKEQQVERRYEKSRNFNNMGSDNYDYGLVRETWCKVECSDLGAHTRFTRKHNKRANASTVFDHCKDFNEDHKNNLAIGQYPEKRHFPERSNVSQQQRPIEMANEEKKVKEEFKVSL